MEHGDRDLAAAWFGEAEQLDRACAVRELREEAGLELRPDGMVGRANEDAAELGGLDPSSMPEIGHWVAPDFLPVRFDARFFAAHAAGSAEPSKDGVEIDAAWWTGPGEALARHLAGELALMWPTFKVLEALATCRTVRDVMSLRVKQVAPPVSSGPAAVR